MHVSVYNCDDCGKTIEDRRVRLEATMGAIAGFPIDVGSGKPTLDLCAGCRDALAEHLARRRAKWSQCGTGGRWVGTEFYGRAGGLPARRRRMTTEVATTTAPIDIRTMADGSGVSPPLNDAAHSM